MSPASPGSAFTAAATPRIRKGASWLEKIRLRDGIAECADTVATIIDLIDDAKEQRGEDTYLEVA